MALSGRRIGTLIPCIIIVILGTAILFREKFENATGSDVRALHTNIMENIIHVRKSVDSMQEKSGRNTIHYKAVKIPEDDRNLALNLPDEAHNNDKFLVYICDTFCGGLGDRLRGIVNTYILSLITGRRFGISHPKPCPLQQFLVPNRYNWVIDPTLLSKKPSKKHSIMGSFKLPSKNMTNYFKEDVIYLKSNTDITMHLRQQVDIPKRIPWFTSLSTADIYRLVFNHLFKLHPSLRKELTKFRTEYVKNSTTVCAHFRVGKNPTMSNDPPRHVGDINELWKFFDRYDEEGKVIYLATDSDDAKATAKKKFPNRFIDIPGKIVHTDRSKDDNECSGFTKTILEHAWLIECDVLLLTDSGYGRTAGFWRANSQNLFCLQITGVLMCSRSTLPHVLPGSYSPWAWKSD